MTLKMKLTSLIASFTLVVGLMLMGIMAVNQATVNMGGSINFTATDVYARVTGKIENAQGEYADKTLPPIEFSAENGTPDQSEWSGLNLLFDDDATPIVITVTVENLAKDRKLTASLTDNTAINENLVKDLKQDGVTYTSGTTKDLDASTGDGTSTTTYVVTFSIADHNKSLPQMDFELGINLMDEGYEPPLEILEGFVFDNGVLTAYNGIATDVVIPNSYSIGYTEDEEMERNFSLDIVPDLAQDLMQTIVFSNWNYTDASGKSGVITYADMMGSGEDFQSLVFPLQVELDYKVAYSEYNEANLQLVETFMAGFDALSSLGYISGGFYTTVGENAKTYYANTADFDVDYPDISSAFPITLELENPISIDMYKNIKSFTFDPNAESDPDALADLQIYFQMLPISTWNYTDAKGNKGTLTAADFMGLTDNVTPISYPIDIEVTYNTTIPTATDENLELCMQLFSNYMQAFEEMKSAGNITGGFYATVNGQPRTLFNSTEEFTNFLMENFEGIDSDPNMIKQIFPMTLELETPVVIPGEQVFVEGNDIEVTEIASGLFQNNTNITSVVLPDTLTTISSNMFSGCTSLQSVTIPEVVTSIGDSAFRNCSGLTSITLPSNLTSIGNSAFEYCSRLTEVDLSNCTSLTSVGGWAFYYCSGLTSITLPSSLTSIGDSAFYNCIGLTEVDLSNYTSLTSVGGWAFYNCSGLTSITLPSSLTSIGDHAFNACSELEMLEYKGNSKQWLSINFGSTWIDDDSHAFVVNGEELTNLVVPEGVTSIGNEAFYGCSGLTEVDLSNCTSLTSIGSRAFYNCTELTSITFPSSLTSIGSNAFYNCHALAEVYNYSNSIKITVGSTSDNFIGQYAKIVYNASDLTGEKPASRIQTINNVQYYVDESEGEFIALAPAVARKSLTMLTLDSRATEVSQYSFSECNELTEVDLSNCISLTSIGDQAFSFCSELTCIILPSSLISIEGAAFQGCYALAEVYNYSRLTISKGSTSNGSAGYYAKIVYNAGDLTGEKPASRIKIIDNVQYYVYGEDFIALTLAVSRESLTMLTLDSRTTEIDQQAFRDCSGLTEVDLSNCRNLTSIGDEAFNSCSGLTSIDLSNCTSLISIGIETFYNCSGLTSITLSSSLTSIGIRAFYHCGNLDSITFPNTTGWYYTTSSTATSGTEMDMSNPEQNATWLTSTYYTYYFKRNA